MYVYVLLLDDGMYGLQYRVVRVVVKKRKRVFMINQEREGLEGLKKIVVV